jgi:hypothetical protein
LATFRARWPSRRESLLLFGVCVFPVHTWAILNLLSELPGWLVRLSLWDIVGIIAYTLVFALLECLVIWLAVVLLSIVLPKRWFRERFVALGTMIVLLTSGWAILAHFNDEALAQWSAWDSFLWFGLYLVSLGVFYTLVFRFDRLERWIVSFADRLLILAYLYLLLDFLAFVIVALRNIGRFA